MQIEFLLLTINGHIHLTTLTITYKVLYFHWNHGNIYCIIPQHTDYPSPLSETIPKQINFSNSMDGHQDMATHHQVNINTPLDWQK